MDKNARIYVAGHTGLVGSGLVRELKRQGYNQILTATHDELDLRDWDAVDVWMYENYPQYIFLAAATVGGIDANNSRPVDFLEDNLLIATNVIRAASKFQGNKLMFMGSSCFKPDALVLTRHGLRHISEIQVGDLVLTHRQRFRRVLQVGSRDYKGELVRIKLRGHAPVVCTSEHPFLTESGFKPASELTVGNRLIIPRMRSKYQSVPLLVVPESRLKWAKYRDFLQGKKVTGISRSTLNGWKRGCKPDEAELLCNAWPETVAWITGAFVADGWVSGQATGKRGSRHNVGFACGHDEEFAERVKLSLQLLWKVEPVNKKVPTGWAVTLDFKPAYQFFKQCYEAEIFRAHCKQFPGWVFTLPEDILKQVLEGYSDGDGHVHHRPGRKNQTTRVSASTSKKVTYALKYLWSLVKTHANLYFVPKMKTCIIEGRRVNQRNQWALRINGRQQRNVSGVDFSEKGASYPIKSIENEQYFGKVWNLEVEEDNSYTADLVAVHNCIYPKHSPQPIKESYLLCGPLEPTNEWYAVAKIAGLKLCQAYRKQKGCNFISVMPTNLYGPGDRYHQGCHVIPALIRRFHEHKSDLQEVKVWGSGDVRREFLYVDDLARACLLLMDKYDGAEPVNIGYGSDITIKCLAGCVAKTVGLDPDRLYWDENALVGTPQKLLDSSVIHSFGWHPEVDLASGLSRAYADYCERYAPATVVNTGC